MRDWLVGQWNWARMMRSHSPGAGMHWLSSLGDLDSGIALVDRALVLNPNLAAAWYLSGFLRDFRGEPDMAIERLRARHAFESARPGDVSDAERNGVRASVRRPF